MSEIREIYPNLNAIIEGRVSGQVTEWPMIKVELKSLLSEVSYLKERVREFEGGTK